MKLTSDQMAFLEDKVAQALKDKATPAEIVGSFATFVKSLEPDIVDPSTTKVKYVGRRPFYDHREFGQWTEGMVKNVPTMLAEKMLKHPDVYVKAGAKEAATENVVDKPKTREDDDEMLQDLRDQVMQSTLKKPIVDIIKANYNHDITTELNTKTAKVLDYQRVALGWIDRFGTLTSER